MEDNRQLSSPVLDLSGKPDVYHGQKPDLYKSFLKIESTVSHVTKIIAFQGTDLPESEIDKIHTFLQYIWGLPHSMGELYQCKNCQKIFNNEVLFQGGSLVCCNNQELKEIYGKEYRVQLTNRYNSPYSYCVICYNEFDEIVGFMDCYIDTPENIFKNEFKEHYSQIPYDIFIQFVAQQIGYLPKKTFALPSLGFLKGRESLLSIVKVFKKLREIIPIELQSIPCITEVNSQDTLVKLYRKIGATSTGIGSSFIFAPHISNTAPHYKSDVIVFANPGVSWDSLANLNLHDLVKTLKSG